MPDVSTETPEPEIADDLQTRLDEIADEIKSMGENMPQDKTKKAAVLERLESLRKEIDAITECACGDAEDAESIKSIRKARRERLGLSKTLKSSSGSAARRSDTRDTLAAMRRRQATRAARASR